MLGGDHGSLTRGREIRGFRGGSEAGFGDLLCVRITYLTKMRFVWDKIGAPRLVSAYAASKYIHRRHMPVAISQAFQLFQGSERVSRVGQADIRSVSAVQCTYLPAIYPAMINVAMSCDQRHERMGSASSEAR